MRPEGPPTWPPHDPEVLDVLRQAHADGSWGRYHGPWCEKLEARLAAYHGVALASLCCSGTFAVELALRSLPVEAGYEVVLAGYDFPGNFHSILAVGARPVLVDVDPHTGNFDPQQLEAAVGPKTRAVIATHLHGGVVPMPAVCEIASRHALRVVEDAAQMPGAMIHGRRAGTWGDVGVLSFGGSKLLSAGRGGALVTRHAEIHHRAKLFCNRGNHAFPLSELQAAVLLPQLEKLDRRNARRAENVRHLLAALGDVHGLTPLTPSPLAKDGRSGGTHPSPLVGDGRGGGTSTPSPLVGEGGRGGQHGAHKLTPSPLVGEGWGGGQHGAETQPGYYKLGFWYDPCAFGNLPRDRFVTMLRAEGIALDAGFRGLAGRSARRCRKLGPLTHARRAGEHIVVLHHPILLGSTADVDQIAAALRKIAAYYQ